MWRAPARTQEARLAAAGLVPRGTAGAFDIGEYRRGAERGGRVGRVGRRDVIRDVKGTLSTEPQPPPPEQASLRQKSNMTLTTKDMVEIMK